MDFKKYYLFFHNKLSVNHLEFNLTDTPVTEKWTKTLVNAEHKDIVDVNLHFSGDRSKIEDQLEELIMLIAMEKPEILNFWKKPLDQKVMNSLHQYFHSSVELENFSSELVITALGKVNPLIHYWESLKIRSSNWVYYQLQSNCKEPITQDLRKYWKIENVPPGSLRLGYHTIGKDLWTCYTDNDLQVVKDGMVRPQMDIYTQVFFRIEGIQLPHSPETMLEKFDAWCDKNNTSVYGVHSRDPIHRSGMKPLLGVLKNPPSKDSILNMWLNAEKITWTLE